MCLSCNVCVARTGLPDALGVQSSQKELYIQPFRTQRFETLQTEYGKMRQKF